MIDLLALVAILAAAMFCGAAVYVSLVEHPARLAAGTSAALAQWKPSYARASKMQVSLAVIGGGSGLYLWNQDQEGRMWLWGSILLLLAIPYTMLVIAGTSRALQAPDRDPAAADTERLLRRWGQLHVVRAVLSFAAAVAFVSALGLRPGG